MLKQKRKKGLERCVSASGLKKYVQAHWQLYLMMLPPLIVLLIFAYGPMYGLILAFKDYKVSLGIGGSPWASDFGLGNFIRFFDNYNFWACLKNTLVLSVYTMLVEIPTAIILALSLNYVKNRVFKKAAQMITYCPYFISTIVFVGIINMLMDNRIGVIGSFLYNNFGINILGSPELFPSLYVWSGVWQTVGYGSIIYVAALASVDMQIHEAAIIDGATLLQRIRYVDIPAILPTAVIMMILNMGRILNTGYEKILAMQNQMNLSTSEVISTYSYKVSLVSTFPDFPLATAIGMFQSVIGLILVLIVNKIAKKISGNGLM
ncbi:MAG: ABC transporter permease subunit [Blautia sp.]|uniref:ABC transporter permease n=1 Tax=Blautia sp. TaxID=1955243 RepID=UPI002E761FFF|nr:ABC transporter permease subunit [Blautia sp.]MEE1442930.1 ABC transporter permease subunit [Blautia sp.]